MNYTQSISSALLNDIESIAHLSNFSTEKLESYLRRVKEQLVVARRNNILLAIQLLEIWEEHLEDALDLQKQTSVIPNPDLSISMVLPELVDYENVEKRQELLRQKLAAQFHTDYIKQK